MEKQGTNHVQKSDDDLTNLQTKHENKEDQHVEKVSFEILFIEVKKRSFILFFLA